MPTAFAKDIRDENSQSKQDLYLTFHIIVS